MQVFKVIHRDVVYGLLLCFLLFIIFFSSAEGIYNSMDAPQFFTTEALLYYHDLGLQHFINNPHNFTHPDVYYRNGQILGLRGYFLSILSLPLHIISLLLKSFITTTNFPSQVKLSPNFAYELSVTSLFTLYSAAGLCIFYFLNLKITKDAFLSSVLTILEGCGTYVWKYSAAYIRQGFLVLLLSSVLYCLWMLFHDKKPIKWLFYLFLYWAISFGIDVIFFLALSLCLGGYLLQNWHEVSFALKQSARTQQGKLGILLVIAIVFINIFLNYHWYGTFFFSQTNLQPDIVAVMGNKTNQVWTSTPLFPTIFSVLFGTDKMPAANFRNFTHFPIALRNSWSANGIRNYPFFGIFTVSPFLLFSFFSFFGLSKTEKNFVKYALVIFIIGIVCNTKVLNFWGGNQYDIRYFYPYTLIPASMVGLGWKNIVLRLKNNPIFSLLVAIFIMTALFSLFMGWFGELSMYKPALTGERKIWVDIYNANVFLPSYSILQLFNATFMNWQNAWIAGMLGIVAFISLNWLKAK